MCFLDKKTKKKVRGHQLYNYYICDIGNIRKNVIDSIRSLFDMYELELTLCFTLSVFVEVLR